MPTKTIVPSSVVTEIKAAPTQGDLVAVSEDAPYEFHGKILKVKTLTLGPRGRLILTALTEPWLAIVAQTIKISAQDERAFVMLPTDRFVPATGSSHPPLGDAAAGGMGSPTRAGSAGAAGIDGLKGNNGTVGHSVPHLYLFADSVVRQDDNAPPDFVDLYFFSKGVDGGNGGKGQNGQNGGTGGGGGPARWNGISCDGGAGHGAPGGSAGGGGEGGDGGNGSNGGDITLGGSTQAINLLEFSKINALPGRGGYSGMAGANGAPGTGGPRGERRGGCGGGNSGSGGAASTAIPVNGNLGVDGQRGKVFTTEISLATLF